MIIFALLLGYNFIKGTFEYEKVTRFKLVIIPIYSAIMMIFSFMKVYSPLTLCVTAILLVLGFLIGRFQISQVQIKNTGQFDSYDRPIIKIKRNWSYLVGWLITFALGIGVELLSGSHLNAGEISSELFTEILKDLSIIAFFRGHSAWFIWVLNVATSFTYGSYLMLRYPKIREAVQKKQKN